MRIKTNELADLALDVAVGLADRRRILPRHLGGGVVASRGDTECYVDWRPSRDWGQGGPVIERESICLSNWTCEWDACMTSGPRAARRWNGPTPLIAAMRCFVASRLGDEVEIPEELCE